MRTLFGSTTRLAGLSGALVAVGVLAAACSSSASVSLPSASVTRAQVTHAYETLFDMAHPDVAADAAVVQDGSKLAPGIAQEIATPLAHEAAGATVQSVKVYSASGCRSEDLPYPCAKVSYTILLPSLSTGNMTGLSGWAVYQHKRWLVAKSTVCALFTLAGNGISPQGCG